MKQDIRITGKVIHGDHIGRQLGFPTANIDRRDYTRQKLHLKFGIYAGTVLVLNSKSEILNSKTAAIVIGPLDKRGLPKLEAHLLNFSGSLYGKKLKFEIGKKIRPWKKIANMESLKRQIQADIQTIKSLQ